MKTWIAVALSAFVLTSATAFSVKDAIQNMTPDKKGIQASHSLFSIFQNAHERLVINAQTKDFVKFLASSFEDFRFQKIYDSKLIRPGAKGFKGVTFQGKNSTDGYIFNLASKHKPLEGLYRMGSFTADTALKKNYRSIVGGPSFSTYFNSKANTGPLSHKSVLSLWEGLLHMCSPDNIRNLKAAKCRESKSSCGMPYDAADEFRKAFPNSDKFFGHFLQFKALSQIMEKDGKEVNMLTVQGKTILDNLNDDYPWVAAHLVDLQGGLKMDVRITNENDNNLMLMNLDSQEDFLTLKICTRDGKIIPFDSFDEPVLDEEYYLTELTDFPFDITVDIFSKANGLKFTTKGIRILGDYIGSSDSMLLTLRSDNLVDTKVTGRAMHILPTWSIDWLLPASMEELIYDFSTVMIQANGGEGTILKIAVDARDPDNNMMHVLGATEILDNFFVRFGATVANDYLSLGPITEKEAAKLLSKSLEVILADLELMQKAG